MSLNAQSSILNLRISETEPLDDSQFAEAFVAALLDAADEYKPSQPSVPRTLGRTIPQRKDERSPAERRKEEAERRKEEKRAAALRKEEEKAEAKRLAEEEKAAAKRQEEERLAAKKMEKETAAAERKAEKARRSGGLSRAFSWLRSNRALRPEKQLRISESISLGEKRFVAVLHVEGRKFLIGGGASGVSLLTPIEPAQSSANVADAIHLVPGIAERSQ